MPFSANLGYLYQDLALPDRVAAAARDGFDAVECHFPYDTDPGLLRAALDAAGLAMISLNTRPGNLAAGDFGLAADPARAGEARAALQEGLAYGQAIGASALHVMAGRSDSGRAAEAALRAHLDQACDQAGAVGMTILIEPLNRRDVPGYHLSELHHAADIIAALGHPNLKILFDCYHMQIMGGDLTRRFAANLPLIGHVQIAAVPDRGEPDRGEVNYPDLLAALDWTGAVGAEYRPRSGRVSDGIGWLGQFRAMLA